VTSFAYTSGNPNNLVANQNASMADIQGPLTDLRAFLNGGTMDETNVPNLSAAFTTYKRLNRAANVISSAAGAGTIYFMQAGGNAIADGTASGGANAVSAADVVIDLDPTEFNANARTTKLNLRVTAIPNAVAPGVTFTTSLWPISTYAGASGSVPLIASVGTLTAGSSVAIASPAATTRVTQVSGDFNCPAAGAYVLGTTFTGAVAAGSRVTFVATLSMRQV